jgi:hypothetical protein
VAPRFAHPDGAMIPETLPKLAGAAAEATKVEPSPGCNPRAYNDVSAWREFEAELIVPG